MSIREQKKQLRHTIITRLEAAGPENLRDESAMISDLLLALPAWDSAKTIFAFLSMDNEVDTFEIIGRALSAGKQLGVPRMHGDEIKFHLIDSTDGPWDLHPYGIREPQLRFPTADYAKDELYPLLVVTPGVAFDLNGRRLGHARADRPTLLPILRMKV